MSYTNDLTNLANIASVVTSGITSNGTAITKISVGNSTVNSVVNSTGIYVNGSVIYQTTDGLSANVLVLTSNAATYLGNSSGTLANIQNYITGNAATAYTNATSYTDIKAGNAYTNAITYSADANNISSGTVAPARLGSGTANSTTILYGNSVFAAAPDSTNASALISGTVNVSLLASYGTANSTTVLYGNSVWAVIPVVNAVATISEQFTANGTANSFTISGGYTPSQVAVFVNGVKQLPITDVDITSGTTINLTSTPLNGYAVDVFGYNTVIPGVLTTANTALFLSNSSGTLVNIQNYITGNAATAYANAIAYSANADNISSGTVTPARLGSGTANSTTILYGNGVFAVPAPGSTNVDAQYAWTNTNSFSANVLIAGNATSQLLIGTINATSIGMLANSTVLTIGNSSVNTTVNATSFSGIANDANNLGGTSLATLQTQITGNAATAYSNGTSYTDIKAGNAYTNATSYVTTGGYTITGAVTYSANVNIAGNTTSALNIGTINATSIGLSANSTVLTMGNSSVNTTVNATSFSGTANNADNLGGTSLATLQGQITGNAATAYTNATSYADTAAGTAYTNATSYADTKAGTAYTNATSYADTKAGNAYTNATTYVTTGGYTITGVVNYSGNVILTSGNATNQLLIGTINATSIGMLANSTVLTVGNSSVNTTINSTALTTTSNTATFGTAVYVIANGNVGIANSAPGSKLTISGGVSSFEALLEKATVSATAATGTVHLDVLTQAVLYYTSNATANFTLNVRANSSVTANSILVNGQSLTVAFLNTTGATAYYPNVFSIDSTTVTPKFSGGTAYTAGNANSIDTYTFTI